MITIGICDDEAGQRKMLKSIIGLEMEFTAKEYDIIEYQSGETLICELERQPFLLDILFLDIELGGMSGVDAAKSLRQKSEHFELIFVTGYADYVFNGYEVNALNYILKPYQPEKIKSVLRTALERLEIHTERYYPVQTQSQTRRIPLSEILYFTSELRKAVLVTKTERIEFYGRLPEILEELPPSFVRAHQRYIVHLKYVEQMDQKNLFLGGQLIPVSRKYYQEVSGAFARYLLI